MIDPYLVYPGGQVCQDFEVTVPGKKIIFHSEASKLRTLLINLLTQALFLLQKMEALK